MAFLAALAGLKSQRLIYLSAFPLALSAALLPLTLKDLGAGLGRFWASLSPRAPSWLSRLAAASGLSGLWAKRPPLSSLSVPLLLGLFLSCAWWAGSRQVSVHWNRQHDLVLAPVRQMISEGETAAFFNWWDDGYFILVRTGLQPFFHGSTQTPETAYVASRPWMMTDRAAAARWMRFFALRGRDTLKTLEGVWGLDQAFFKLEQMFLCLNPDGSRREGSSYPADLDADLAALPGGLSYIFPQGRVFWFIPREFMDLSAWWVAMGYSRPARPDLVRPHITAIGREEFVFDRESRNLTLTDRLKARGYEFFGDVVDTSVTPLAAPWPSLKFAAPYIVFSPRNRLAYITDQLGLSSLPLALMAPGGAELDNFKAVSGNYEVGGLWEVLN
jgi:hypothetical protein